MNDLFTLLASPTPGATLLEWHASGKLADTLPEVAALFGVPQNALHHPEVDTGIHVSMCLDIAHQLDASPAARFAVLVHDLGKALTPVEDWPRHLDHERLGLPPVAQLCDRHQVPAPWRQLAMLVCEYHLQAHRAFEMRSRSVIKLLHTTGMESDPQLLEDFLIACEADKRGRLGMESGGYPQGDYLREVAQALQPIPALSDAVFLEKAGQERYRQRLDAARPLGIRYRAAQAQAKHLRETVLPA